MPARRSRRAAAAQQADPLARLRRAPVRTAYWARMSRQSIEVAHAAFEAWQQRGFAFLFDFLAADIDWEVRPDLPDAGRYQGHDGVRRLSARFDEVTDERWYRPEEFVPVGADQVVVPLTWGGRGRGSGVNFEERRETWVLTVRAGKIVRVREFATREQALTALGLQDHPDRTSSAR
jgi:ketosteroid isomerase-like protein